MTTVAWDGHTLAADKQVTQAGHRWTTTKVRRIGEALAAICGPACYGEAMFHWFENGARHEDFPHHQRHDSDENAVLAVVLPDCKVRVYDWSPLPLIIEDPQYAMGSGRDYAMGAMARGATAEEAVQIAARYDNGTGRGIDTLRFVRA